LDGVDKDWQDAGVRREAFYTNLGPGKYRFHTNARNEGGEWNTEEAVLDFTIAPAWFQTIQFRAFCGCVFLILLWMLYQLRLRHLERQFAMRLEIRVSERTRIARDLHDTLLQTLHGLMFQFQAVRNLMPRRPDEAMKSLDDAIHETEKALTESRDAIQGLRSEPSANGNLAELLMATSQELASSENSNHHPPSFELLEEGERRSLSATTNNEVCWIALEILRNAYRHAQARRIETEVRYGDDTLRLRIRDDGKGIEANVLKEGGIAGHWGLQGIRERAERLGAQLDFWSEAGAGTEVQLAVPASVAYEASRDGIGSTLFRRRREHGQRS
jgi:signal transduction histidine kinase